MDEGRQGILMMTGQGLPSPVHQQQPPSWCGCPATVNNTNENHSFCAVCLGKYDCTTKVPMGLHCGHTVCRRCALRLHPDFQGIPNAALLSFLEFPMIPLPPLEPDCGAVIYRLSDIALLLKANNCTRAIHRKVLNLICSLTYNGQNRICKAARAIGERVLTELCAACSHLSHYHAQQQLWGAIRSRACQFMGPAMQEEALKLVLLALEDGSPLSRKVLVMFVVQRLAPQFPQASKTSIGHVIQLLYRASCFDVTKRLEASSLMTLRPEYRNYESLRREHDAQIVKIALECGIRFSPEQWSSILYGDSNHKPHMQSIIDKLQAPQTFLQMTTEFLVTIQRLSDSEDTNFFLSIHPRFQLLASIDILPESPPLPWAYVNQILEAVHCVLLSLFNFTAPKTKTGSHSHNALVIRNGSNGRLGSGVSMLNRNVGGEIMIPPPIFPPQPPPPQLPPEQQYFSNQLHHQLSSPFRAGILHPNGFSPLPQQQQRFRLQSMHHPFPANGPPPSSTEIKEILTESRMLQARMKELQEKMPEAVALALEEEAFGLEEAVTQMVQRVSIH